jgi:hypothetical protein
MNDAVQLAGALAGALAGRTYDAALGDHTGADVGGGGNDRAGLI